MGDVYYYRTIKDMVNEDLLEQHIRLTFKEFSSLEKLYDIFVHKYLTLCFRQS